MSAPWEEEWRVDGARWIERRNETISVAQVHVGRVVEEQVAYARLIAAAPDMARALLRVVEQSCETARLDIGGDCATMYPGDPTERCRVCEAHAALKKAGVLP